MKSDELARQVAAKLAPEFGGTLKNRTEEALRGELTRGFDLSTIANVAVIAHFIVTISPTVLAQWGQLKDKAGAIAGTQKQVQIPPELTREQGDRIISTAVDEAAEQENS